MGYQGKLNWQYGDTVTEQDMNRIESGIVETQARVDAHESRKDNPHAVTPEQIGAETPSGAQLKVDEHRNAALSAHKASAIALDDISYNFIAENVEDALAELFTAFNDRLSTKNLEKFNKDRNGYYTTVEYSRAEDNSLYMRMALSNPDANGNYQTHTLTYYKADGVTVDRIEQHTISYDADGEPFKYL
ncbi:hypothetical protein [Tumebacillus lipolyticus]|uniref:Large polyvalent protein-associated domain-containing protein n=1 Tax=Tumebacillus lipolyticus TaxID=1280370 RepID=A0ABW4ZWM3_9BACL